jgi:hypothetical protein
VAYLRAFPFDKMVEGMMSPRMPQETAEVMRDAIKQGVQANVIINNRAGGNAPLIAQKVAETFLQGSKQQVNKKKTEYSRQNKRQG